MTQKFDSIPFDIWHEIASYLGPDDYVNLSLVNREMYELLKDDMTARKSAQKFMFHSAECRLAASGQISYCQAIRRAFDVREAVANAQPYSASVVAYAESFQFKQGVLCYKYRDTLRVLNVRDADDTEQVIDVRVAFFEVVLRRKPHDSGERTQITLLHYSDGIASCLCKWAGLAWLVAFDVRPTFSEVGTSRVRTMRQLYSTDELFVRNNASYLYYGTHSGEVQNNHFDYREWLIHGVYLPEDRNLTKRPLQLENVVGSEVGSTICFEIRDDYLYVVSNQTSHEEEEVDWTSFYVCVRIPLSQPTQPIWRRCWRRQHQEGPLNDSWTDLSLKTDEETGNLTIVECRREWRNGGSENYRTFYMQPIDRPSAQAEWEADDLDPVTANSPLPGDEPPSPGFPCYRRAAELPNDDPLTRTLDAFSKPNYVPPRKRVRRQYHDEYTFEERTSDSRKDFPLSKTKFWTYNHSASSFVDLVNDPRPTKGFSAQADRLRLRIGSRKRKCPIDEQGEEVERGSLYPPEYFHGCGVPVKWSEERYKSRGIKFWPPDDAPEELLQLLCPRTASGRIEAAADERMIVYLTKASQPDGPRQVIVLINFDPTIRFKGLKRLSQPSLTTTSDSGNTNTRSIETDAFATASASSQPKSSSFPSLSRAKSYSTSSRPYSHDAVKGPACRGKKLRYTEPRWFTIESASYHNMPGYWLR
ncbi:hypothetical protein D8B26_004992 [Coccidioides posadasii str. Silveira]|uniref:F-box domain-containing protein n=2 Tax=Coccidioides posadasii TaxID=199306 RepID=A0A0J6I4Z0_COCPO|nr:F-box domain containing protein [Coccidioides posadasii C735 delta SOWgp]EER24651.1 F-box domain containing protein [Coccidioides posadasii C735 delta SOWgp]KMM66457.1 F-box domain-containing protein [Coccidioides posadasii RMSCC 3488]QVM10332.1 hypothetical protein D8B26_004992 [Coccidioides posadasii str. Silveira]|eukprot:XP_003066796.1 F-box domain containing protein [Coccidioides posadasii C735 delta SOWgp]